MDRRGPSKLHRCGLLARNILIAALAYTSVFELIHVYRTGSISPFVGAPPAVAKLAAPAADAGTLSGGVNWRLRPDTLVADIDDGFLGARPHVDTLADYGKLIENCRGSKDRLEKMRNVFNCLDYLAHHQRDYHVLPESPPSRASPDYPAVDAARAPTETDIGECPGPVQLYHTFWTGPATWRVELFVKGYLHTQNLPCSRLYIWLDADTNPNAVEDMMADPLFARFLPLVERGDILLKPWHFPSRIPLPPGTVAADPQYKKHLSPATGELVFPNNKDELYIGDGLLIRRDGSEWIVLTERQMTFLPVAVSDAVRFIVLHLYGGAYFDMDILMLRDLRPLLLPPDHNFAERWATHNHPGDFNTAVLSLNANSSLSSYLVRGGVRMGLNFHPRIIGRMAWKDGRVDELAMFETGLFDPIWGEFNWGREGRCTVPCLRDYGLAFLGGRDAVPDEWQSYDGPALPLRRPPPGELRRRRSNTPDSDDTYDGAPYDIDADAYPPNNRTMQNFFRGAYTYHIHNQWSKHPQPNSWFDVVMKAQDGFLRGDRVNPYGERWTGPAIAPYERWPEFD